MVSDWFLASRQIYQFYGLIAHVNALISHCFIYILLIKVAFVPFYFLWHKSWNEVATCQVISRLYYNPTQHGIRMNFC